MAHRAEGFASHIEYLYPKKKKKKKKKNKAKTASNNVSNNVEKKKSPPKKKQQKGEKSMAQMLKTCVNYKEGRCLLNDKECAPKENKYYKCPGYQSKRLAKEKQKDKVLIVEGRVSRLYNK